MKKEEFLAELRSKLSGLPKEDIDNRIEFYNEMIEDRIDEGKSEEEAVADIGTVDEIVNEIAKDTSLAKLMKERIRPKRALRAWEIVLIVLGFPLWLPLVLVGIVLALVAYLLIWILVLVTYAGEIGLIGWSIASLVAFFGSLSQGEFSWMYLGASIMAAGGAILLFFGCIGATKLTLRLSKKIITGIKASFIKKGNKES